MTLSPIIHIYFLFLVSLLFFDKLHANYFDSGGVLYTPSINEILGGVTSQEAKDNSVINQVVPAVKDESGSKCDLNGEIVDAREAIVNLTVSNGVFRSDMLIPGVVYQITLKSGKNVAPIEYTLKSFLENTPQGEFSSIIQENNCGESIFRSRLDSYEQTLNWTLKTNKEFIKSNLTFQLEYRHEESPLIHRTKLVLPIKKECQLYLLNEEATIHSDDFPQGNRDCDVHFPNNGGHGLIVELTRLNVPCSRGFLRFSGLNITQHHHGSSNHKQPGHMCGKLEELPETERRIYFPASSTPPLMHLHSSPVFALSYYLVDYCYNVSFLARNGSFELKPSGKLMCTFKIYLPYGNRVAMKLQIGDTSTTTESLPSYLTKNVITEECDGLQTELIDEGNNWSHCARRGDAERQIEIVSRGNRVMLKVTVNSLSGGTLSLKVMYRAEPIEEIVGLCGFGWVAYRQFCISAVESSKLSWSLAEAECARRGGHLASVRSLHVQEIVDNLLLNSPGYREHNAYWIGASDKTYEGDFRWSDGLPFSFTNWFPGWSQHGHYNRQPNDDGLSDQDCVEVRRVYALPSSSNGLASNFMWNDRDCSTPNFFICERLQNDEPLEDGWIPDCNRSVVLSREHPRASVSSPGFPRHYPDNVDCNTDITAPAGYRLLLDFEELVLENEPSCSYDFLEISETSLNISDSKNLNQARRLCGDWSSKLKLLRYVSSTSRLKLRFSSDYSHHFGGYKARVSMENALQCADDRFHLFNNSCYLFVSYPEVAWNTAQQICDGINANLASVLSPEEERFITTNIRKTPEYRTSALYWLGGKIKKDFGFFWMDKKPVSFTNWMPGQKPNEIFRKNNDTIKCLGIQWLPSPTPILPSGLYWRMQRCSAVGGYVCKRPNQILGLGINFNQTVNGSDGTISTPNFPGQYYNNLDFSIRIVGPKRTRLLIKFNKIDIESQLECLYDYVEIKSKATGQQQSSDAIKWCGSHDVDMHRFDFVSQTNEAELKFHSDYSISGSGFKLSWHAVDVSSCPSQTLTAREGSIASPNYPNFLLSQLNCSITIQAPAGHRIWLEFDNVDLGIDNDFDAASESANSEAMLELSLGKHSPLFTPFQNKHLLTEGSYLSNDEHLTLRLTTLNHPMGNGFQAHYKIVSTVKEEKIIRLGNMSSGLLLHLNYPDNPAVEIDFKQHLIVPLGNIISLELHHLKLGTAECLSNDDGVVEIYDNYSADENGTHWKLCYANTADARELISPSTPIEITSFLNTLHLRQKSKSLGIRLNGTLRVSEDGGFKAKIFKHSNDVESCNPNPCLNGGKCITRDKKTFCQCMGHFTGLFCALTSCELEPCLFGTCELTNSSYKCHCKSGYIGPACEQKRRPCESNPCEGRGLCMDRGDSFLCRCHAWWEGQRCEKRMLHIPYKPLSERMLHEPFWLGLMTVFVVMAVIGLVWCAKRHFPEKIEKLLAEEQERNRSTMISLRSSSVREQLAAAAAAASAGGNQGTPVTPSPGGSANPRSILGRLGIRKPSLLSLTSPHASPATARTFSLDDLLKPLPRRTPSPKKKRNNSTPTKKNVAEKKLILQQLVSPGNKHLSKKVSLGELIQLSDGKDLKSDNNTLSVKETMFGGVDTAQSALNDPKLEKKVTFARLLNKVSAEMNSGSDMELGIMRVNKLGVAFARPSSTPPSPSVTMRSPNSTSSNQGSDSFSSDLAIPSALSSSISDLLSRRQSRLPNLTNGKPKPASADSILAMFRNFSSSSAGVNLPSSLRVSPSTTPTASSPQDDIAGDDESSTSSIHTPVSFSSGCPESPIMHRNNQSTIEISVMDSLSAHKSSSSGSNLLHPPTILLEIPSTINKCLSPIREMPTPLPSPMPSPAPQMRRTYASAQVEDIDSDDRISVELPNISISCSDGDDDDNRLQDIALDLQAEDGLILEEVAMMNCYKTRNRPSPLGQTSDNQRIIIEQTPLVIPTLVIQTPSPTRSPASFHGSPPPHKPRQETMFPFPPSSHYWQQSRKKLKDYDKPTSLDLPCAPPMITITCNMSEVESDADSPATKACGGHLGIPTTGMSYLSPFSMGARGDHTTSESNLSSSGYSSMASPGPSRCGSSNPLCPSEMEDQGPPGSGPSHRRPSPILKTNSNPSECSTGGNKNGEDQRRGRSDSETLSDDPLLESNDEGIGTDHIEEKIDDGDLKSAKELQVFITGDCDTTLLVDVPQTNLIPTLVKTPAAPQVVKCVSLDDSINRLQPPLISKHSLQLPSIVVQCDTDKLCVSPVSSRSESPLSDRTTGLERFSPQFYGRHKDLLPFTDSDGLYDFPSTDKVNVVSSTHKKIGNKKREKKPLTRNCKTPSPSKTHYAIPGFNTLLDVPSKDHYKVPPPRKLSPKRRVTRSQVVSSSSSSDSIVTAKDLRPTSSSPSPDTIRWSSPIEWIDHKLQKSQGASGEEDVVSTILPKATDFSKNQKISRLRAIGHQIRFLRRLELSLKRRDRAISPSDSIESGEDSPRATSPLLPNRGPKPEIRKSSSIGKLGSSTSRPKRSKYKKGDLLLTDQESSWKRVVITDTGHSE